MIEIDVFSGFLGAGKTTLIKKLLKEAYKGEKIVLIENEFGEIGIDGGFMKDAGITVNEMNSGCICCSLVGDFGKALEKVIAEMAPDRILIEPSGVGKLSDVLNAINKLESKNAKVGGAVTVVDAGKFKVYSKNFGEFFWNQIEHAATVVLSHTDNVADAKLEAAVDAIREKNPKAIIVTTPWDKITGEQIMAAVKKSNPLEEELKKLAEEAHEHEHEHHHHHHDHDDHDEHCTCGCHDHDHEHEHHHDDDDEHEHDHEHEHHHHHDHDEHGEHCTCGCHDHDHEGHHHADEVFSSWGIETTHKYTAEEITEKLEALMQDSKYGMILRAKGIVPAADGRWIHFDYVPGEPDVRFGTAEITGRLCVIGSGIKEEALAELFA